MTITLNTKEFDEAVLLWLKEQGFSTDRYHISNKLTVGRGDLGAGTRMEVTLDPIPTFTPTPLTALDIAVATGVTTKGPSFSKVHADEDTTVRVSIPKFSRPGAYSEGPVTTSTSSLGSIGSGIPGGL
jgi:hypothetical protein